MHKPIGSTYVFLTYIYHQHELNVGKYYTIHGSSGKYFNHKLVIGFHDIEFGWVVERNKDNKDNILKEGLAPTVVPISGINHPQ